MIDFFKKERAFLQWDLNDTGLSTRLFEDLKSTHTYTKEHIRDFLDGALVVANSQENGRGRHDRIWKSPKNKNLYFNITFSLNGFEKHQYPQLMQVTAIVIAEFMRNLSVDASVKWPNDLLFRKEKFCGMVADLFQIDQGDFLTIGIGLNVNTQTEDLKDLGRPATSLKIILGKSLDREAILKEIVKRILISLQMAKKEGISPWINEWRKMDKFLGHKARIVEGKTIIEGTILDINENGSLLFETTSGDVISRYSGDLEI